jgi:hypothetical protein
MSISNFVTDAFDLLKAGRDETALLTISSAVDTSAKHQYKHLKNVGDHFRTFFDDNLALITTSGIGIKITGRIFVPGEFGDLPRVERDERGNANLRDLFYEALRCSLVHESKIHNNIVIGKSPELGLTEDGKLHFPKAMIIGIALAVIGLPCNRNLGMSPNYAISVGGKEYNLNDFWGKRYAILRLFEQPWRRPGLIVKLSELWQIIDSAGKLKCDVCGYAEEFPYKSDFSIDPKGFVVVGFIGEDRVNIRHRITNCPPAANFREIFVNCRCGNSLFAFKDE